MLRADRKVAPNPLTVSPPPRFDRVTAREGEVLRLIARGLSNKEIASQLRISVSTVNQHTHSLLLKLGATNRTQLAVAALNLRRGRGRS